MAAKESGQSSDQIYAMPVEGIVDLTIASNQICRGGSNAYEIRNAVILAEKKTKIRYKNGETLPNSAINLLNDAARAARHSRILGSNLLHFDKNLKRPQDVDAHHVVAAQDAREILFFVWFIGINDAANGIFMRRFPSSMVAGLAKSPPHQGDGNIHTDLYYLTVFRRLDRVSDKDATIGRATLRAIGAAIIAGTFPY
ncbi:MAG: hypothetical protein RL748_3651 [Pseudomonadota bacterium]|jgi:hypothetical protein